MEIPGEEGKGPTRGIGIPTRMQKRFGRPIVTRNRAVSLVVRAKGMTCDLEGSARVRASCIR
jgi:hypothetical protein